MMIEMQIKVLVNMVFMIVLNVRFHCLKLQLCIEKLMTFEKIKMNIAKRGDRNEIDNECISCGIYNCSANLIFEEHLSD